MPVLLTVCLHVRSGQSLLHECLDGIRGVGDEIVLCAPAGVDLGKQPSAHAQTRRLSYADAPLLDLDAVLNAALAEARGEWILYLEAHERLDANAAELRAALARAHNDAFCLPVVRLGYRLGPSHRPVAMEHHLSHGALTGSSRRTVRLFRRRPDFQFGGRLDPAVEPALCARKARVVDAPAWTILDHSILQPVGPYETRERFARARHLLACASGDPDVWLDLGRLLVGPSPGAARECFLEAWKRRQEAGALVEVALALVAERRFDEAIDILDRANHGEPAHDGRFNAADILELRGEVLRSRGRGGEAADAYTRALAISPDRPATRLGLVGLLCERDGAGDAARHARWLLDRYPGLCQSWIASALVHLADRRPLAAIGALKTALDIDPASVVARYNLAIAFARLGARRASGEALRHARAVKGGMELSRELAVAVPPVSTPLRVEPLGDRGVVSFIPRLAGGAGRVATDIVRCLAPAYRQVMVTYDDSDLIHMGLHQELAELGVPVVSIASGNQLAALQRHLDPAVMLFHSCPPGAPNPFAGTDALLVSVSHGRGAILPSNHDRYVCLSESHRRDLAYLPGEKVTIIPNGVNPERFDRGWRTSPERARNASRITIAMLTRLDHSKCTRRLLHHLEPLADLDVAIVIAGQGPRRWEIEADLAKFAIGTSVHFVGPIPSREVPSFLARADIGLHLTETDHETLSVSILEMLAAGLPVVAQPRGCLPELVIDGVNGFLRERESEVAAALRRLVLDTPLRGAMGEASVKRAAAYSMSRFDTAWRELIDECAAEHRRRPLLTAPIAPMEISRGAAAFVRSLQPGPSNDRPASYFIAATRRTGGTLLCSALHATGAVGYPREDLAQWTCGLRGRSWRYPDMDDYLVEQYHHWASPRGHYGVRLMWEHFVTLCAAHGTRDWPHRWLNLLGPSHWFFLRRRDRLAQAISLYRAEQTGAWSDIGEPAVEAHPVPYRRDAIEACRHQLELDDQAWQTFFAELGIVPLEIFYEDLVADVEGTVRRMLGALSIDPPQPLHCETALRRQADDQTREWLERFVREAPIGAR